MERGRERGNESERGWEYTSVHSGNLHIDFPGKMRYSWEAKSYVAETEGDPRAIAIRQAHLNRESTATRHLLPTEEVKKKKILRRQGGRAGGKEEEEAPATGKGRREREE